VEFGGPVDICQPAIDYHGLPALFSPAVSVADKAPRAAAPAGIDLRSRRELRCRPLRAGSLEASSPDRRRTRSRPPRPEESARAQGCESICAMPWGGRVRHFMSWCVRNTTVRMLVGTFIRQRYRYLAFPPRARDGARVNIYQVIDCLYKYEGFSGLVGIHRGRFSARQGGASPLKLE